MVSQVIKFYKTIAVVKINWERLVGLQLSTRKGNFMPLDSVVGRWTKGPVELLRVWFGPDLLVEKNWAEVSTRVNHIVKTLFRRWLYLKGRAEVANVSIASAIVSLPVFVVDQIGKTAVSLVEWLETTCETSACSQNLLMGGLGMPWLLMRRLALRVRHLWVHLGCFSDVSQVH